MPRPNILLLLTDQQRFDTIACANADPAIRSSIRTPNLDKLCAQGLRFDRAYTPNPVCIPARHNLITGLPARYHGYPDNASTPLPRYLPVLPQLLADAGYRTHAVGKMHFQPMRRHHGFDRMELMEETPKYRSDDDYLLYLLSVGCNVAHQHGVRHLLYHQPQRSLVPEEHHGSKWVADRSVAFLRQAAKEQRPFFLKSSWIAPHPPENVPDRLADMYVNATFPQRIERHAPRPDGVDLIPMARSRFELGDGMLNDPARYRRHVEHYHASVAFVDEQVGRVLAELDALGLADNTLVLFTSDHGEMLGDLDCFQKSLPYESACHISLILRFPGRVPNGSVESERFVDLNDVLPTFLDAASVTYPGPVRLPGGSLLDLDKGRDRSIQYIENGRGPKRWCAIRTAHWKFVHSYYGGVESLFDLESDPKEQRDLLLDGVPPELASEYRGLRRTLAEYEKQWGMPGMVEWNDFLAISPFKIKTGAAARNAQYPPPWLKTLSADERAEVADPLEEIVKAVEKEPAVKLSALDLDGWSETVGTPNAFVEKVRREGL